MSNKELSKELRKYLELFRCFKDEEEHVDLHPRRTLNYIRHIIGCWEVFEYRLKLEKEREVARKNARKTRTTELQSVA